MKCLHKWPTWSLYRIQPDACICKEIHGPIPARQLKKISMHEGICIRPLVPCAVVIEEQTNIEFADLGQTL